MAHARAAHSQPSDPAETAAEQAANAVSRGEPAHVSPFAPGAALGASIGGLSTRARIMRRARTGALPILVTSTPVPGEGAVGRKKLGLEPEEKAQAETEAAQLSGVSKRGALAPPEAPGAPSGAAGGGAPGGAAGAGAGAPGGAAGAGAGGGSAEVTDALGEARRKRIEEDQNSRDTLGQGRSSLEAIGQAQHALEKQREEQATEEATKAGEKQAEIQTAATPTPGSTAAEQSTAAVEKTTEKAEAVAPAPAPETVATEAAKDKAEVAESEAGAEAQKAATEGAPVEAEGKKKEKAPASPDQDPAFAAVVAQARAVTFQQGHNTAAERKVADMQQAVTDPAGSAEAKAKGAQVAGPMAAAAPAPFNRAAFEQAVFAAIAGVEPGSPEQAKSFRVPGSVGGAASAAAASAEGAAAGPVASATAAAPSTAGIETQAGGAVPPTPAGPAPGDIGAEQAAPKPRGESEVEEPLRAPAKDFDQKLENSEFSEKTFENSNEPELTGVLTERDDARKKTDEAIEQNRASEGKSIDAAKSAATDTATSDVGQMHDTRTQEFASVTGAQKEGKSQEEQARDEIKQKLGEIYDRTKKKVDDKLKDVDTKVDAEFSRGVTDATNAYQTYTEGEVGSTLNFLANLFDWTEFKNRVYAEGRRRWQNSMKTTIGRIADIVATGLNEAHQIAVDGAQEARTWFEKQPAEKQRLGQAALEDIQSKFDDLKKTVEDHGNKLVTDLADRYKKALKDLDERIAADKAKNQSLWEKAAALLEEGLALLKKLKEMLLGIASSAADVIGQILSDPITFLSTLIEGVKGGLSAFVQNIGTHLQKGLMTWLLGQLPPGITLPETFDLKGVITLGLQILGLTYANFRARAVAIVGEPIVKALETAAEVFLVFVREGPAGLYRFIQDKLAELKDMVLDGIRNLVITEVVKAGIAWIIGLLSPASALVKAVKMIIDIVMFFVTRGSQIVQLVQAVVGSLKAIASGNSGAVARAVESALASAIPVVLGFLAALAGLGGIPQKIQAILDKIRAPINKAIDFVINLAVKLVKAAGKFIAGLFGGKKDDRSAATDPEKAAKKGSASKAFSLPEEGHTVSAKAEGGQLTVDIASPSSGPILAMLADAKAEVGTDATRSPAQKTQLLTTLDGARQAVLTMRQDWIATPKQQLDFPVFAERRLAQIVSVLAQLGGQGIKAFRDFVGGIPEKRFLPAGYDVRAKLYERGSGWSSNRAAVAAAGLASIHAAVATIIQNRTTNPTLADATWNRLVRDEQAPEGTTQAAVTAADVNRTKYEVDHREVLSIHWQSRGGNNGPDAPRWALSDPANLRLITATANQRRQKGRYVPFVGKGFSSTFAEGGSPNARSIDGQPFLDANRKPI